MSDTNTEKQEAQAIEQPIASTEQSTQTTEQVTEQAAGQDTDQELIPRTEVQSIIDNAIKERLARQEKKLHADVLSRLGVQDIDMAVSRLNAHDELQERINTLTDQIKKFEQDKLSQQRSDVLTSVAEEMGIVDVGRLVKLMDAEGTPVTVFDADGNAQVDIVKEQLNNARSEYPMFFNTYGTPSNKGKQPYRVVSDEQNDTIQQIRNKWHRR